MYINECLHLKLNKIKKKKEEKIKQFRKKGSKTFKLNKTLLILTLYKKGGFSFFLLLLR